MDGDAADAQRRAALVLFCEDMRKASTGLAQAAGNAAAAGFEDEHDELMGMWERARHIRERAEAAR